MTVLVSNSWPSGVKEVAWSVRGTNMRRGTFILAVAAMVLVSPPMQIHHPQAQTAAAVTDRPRVLEVSSVAPEKNARLSSLITDIRSRVDAFVFLSGGASRMGKDEQRRLLAM